MARENGGEEDAGSMLERRAGVWIYQIKTRSVVVTHTG